MLSSRLNAFVIPTSQTRPMQSRERRSSDDLDGEPAREHDPGGRELGGELRERAERVEVVREPGERRGSCNRRGFRTAPRSARPHRRRRRAGRPRTKPAKMPTPPKIGVAPFVPALARRLGYEPLAEVGAKERPEDESRDGKAASVTIALTSGKRRAALLGLCEQARGLH